MLSSLVVHFACEDQNAGSIGTSLAEIARHPSTEIGATTNNRLPVVIDVSGPDEANQVTDWIANLPGIAHVDVAFVYLEENEEDFDVQEKE